MEGVHKAVDERDGCGSLVCLVASGLGKMVTRGTLSFCLRIFHPCAIKKIFFFRFWAE